jgi:hypothetical protein
MRRLQCIVEWEVGCVVVGLVGRDLWVCWVVMDKSKISLYDVLQLGWMVIRPALHCSFHKIGLRTFASISSGLATRILSTNSHRYTKCISFSGALRVPCAAVLVSIANKINGAKRWKSIAVDCRTHIDSFGVCVIDQASGVHGDHGVVL